MSLLECKNLEIGYDGKIVAGNINFKIEDGDYIVAIGENGAGKTTLLKTLVGLKKSLSGEIIRNIASNELGYLPQINEHQGDFPATVIEIVSSARMNKKWKFFLNKEDKKIIDESLQKVNAYDLKKRSFKELSGGQKQRVLLARALASGARLLFLDEPITGLDPEATIELYEIIKLINNEGIAIFMISHDIKNAISDSKYILKVSRNSIFQAKEEYLEGGIK